MTYRILIIDDDETPNATLREYFDARGVQLDRCAGASSALRMVERGAHDAVVIDATLADLDGFALCRKVRACTDIPIVMLTAPGDSSALASARSQGADDCLSKPFEPRALWTRLDAALQGRRDAAPSAAVLRFGRLEIDRARREVRLDGTPRELTGRQFSLLLALARHAGRVQSREELTQAVWGRPLELYDRSIDVHISRIRAAIEDNPQQPKRIKTVRGVGYVFVEAQAATPDRS